LPGTRLYSPDGGLVASFFALAGGGAAGWAVVRLSIDQASADFDSKRFAVQFDEEAVEVCLDWVGRRRLLIQVPDEARVLESLEENMSGVELVIERVPYVGGELQTNNCNGVVTTGHGEGAAWELLDDDGDVGVSKRTRTAE
jgi:hypothetical protein